MTSQLNPVNEIMGAGMEAGGAVFVGLGAVMLYRLGELGQALQFNFIPERPLNPEMFAWACVAVGLFCLWGGLNRSRFDQVVVQPDNG